MNEMGPRIDGMRGRIDERTTGIDVAGRRLGLVALRYTPP